MKKILPILVSICSFIFLFTLINQNVSAKMIAFADHDFTVYKMRKGKTVQDDIFLKSFVVKKGTRLTQDDYIDEIGGWEVSTKDFHSGKYCYYFTTSDGGVWANDNEYSTNPTPQMPIYINKNYNGWITSKPIKGKKIHSLNNKKDKRKLWNMLSMASMYYKKDTYIKISSGNLKGWINKKYLTLPKNKLVLLNKNIPNHTRRYSTSKTNYTENYENGNLHVHGLSKDGSETMDSYSSYGDEEYLALIFNNDSKHAFIDYEPMGMDDSDRSNYLANIKKKKDFNLNDYVIFDFSDKKPLNDFNIKNY